MLAIQLPRSIPFYVAQGGEKLEAPVALEALRERLESVLGGARGSEATPAGEQQPSE